MISPPLYHPTSTLADAPAVLRGIADLESLNLHADERESLRLIAVAIELEWRRRVSVRDEQVEQARADLRRTRGRLHNQRKELRALNKSIRLLNLLNYEANTILRKYVQGK